MEPSCGPCPASRPGKNLARCTNGRSANNQVYRLQTDAGPTVLKVYFRHPADLRDRLAAEYSFCSFAWRQGGRTVPRPLACDRQTGFGLYEFLPGRRLLPGEVGAAYVEEAARFVAALNRNRLCPEAQALGCASEGAFSLDDHCAIVRRRVERLKEIAPTSTLDRAAVQFVQEELSPTWQRVERNARQLALTSGIEFHNQLGEDARGLSPSDFGFHNAILGEQGGLRFVDFEYAGWDDPARMVCDFYSQPAPPVPPTTMESFAASVAAVFPNPQSILDRVGILLPVYRVKWCCIVLNDFLPVGSRRRQFSGQGPGEETKARQFAKAQALLAGTEL